MLFKGLYSTALILLFIAEIPHYLAGYTTRLLTVNQIFVESFMLFNQPFPSSRAFSFGKKPIVRSAWRQEPESITLFYKK